MKTKALKHSRNAVTAVQQIRDRPRGEMNLGDRLTQLEETVAAQARALEAMQAALETSDEEAANDTK